MIKTNLLSAVSIALIFISISFISNHYIYSYQDAFWDFEHGINFLSQEGDE